MGQLGPIPIGWSRTIGYLDLGTAEIRNREGKNPSAAIEPVAIATQTIKENIAASKGMQFVQVDRKNSNRFHLSQHIGEIKELKFSGRIKEINQPNQLSIIRN